MSAPSAFPAFLSATKRTHYGNQKDVFRQLKRRVRFVVDVAENAHNIMVFGVCLRSRKATKRTYYGNQKDVLNKRCTYRKATKRTLTYDNKKHVEHAPAR